jgi:hypothetical protein
MRIVRTLSGAAATLAIAGTLIVDGRAEQSTDTPQFSQALADMNVALAAAGSPYRVDRAEISVSIDGIDTAQTLIANNRTHQIESLFAERDPRRGGGSDITYLVDQSDGAALAFGIPSGIVTLPNAVTEPIIDRGMLRWQNSPSCGGPLVTKLADNGSDPDIVDALVTGNPAAFGTPQADVTHGGWLPPSFFELLAPGGATRILGVTFTLIFVDANGNPTDIDNNHRSDTAFREIYYNLAFGWSEGPSRPRGIDIDSVSTHESGHAMGLGHFGKVAIGNKGDIKYSPRAVMNAVYISPFAELAGTDNASYCSIWAHRQ